MGNTVPKRRGLGSVQLVPTQYQVRHPESTVGGKLDVRKRTGNRTSDSGLLPENALFVLENPCHFRCTMRDTGKPDGGMRGIFIL